MGLSEYSAINAKINGMRRRLLKSDDYDRLISLGSVQEIGLGLKEFEAYKNFISSDAIINRSYIERKVVLSIYDEFSKIFRFVGNRSLRSYFEAFFLKNEISFIKSLLRSINDERDISYSLPEINELIGRYLHFDFSALFMAKTFGEAIEALKDTEFYSVLKFSGDVGSEKLFDLEMRLDIYYFIHLRKLQLEHLHGVNKEITDQTNGFEMDCTNLHWIYRLKKYYNINDASIYAYLIPVNYRLRKDQIARMVESRSLEELAEEIEKTPYADLMRDPDNFERNFYIQKGALLQRMRRQHINSIANVLLFLFIKELEIKNIVSLIEGVRYSLKPEEISRYIIALSEKEVI